MGNVIESFFSGLGHGIASLFNTPLDFLSGKNCNSVCGATWDFICYIENFCVTHLLKMAMVLLLCYIALLFLYMLYKLRICSCVVKSLCRFYCACVVCFFSACNYCCRFVFIKILKIKRRRKRRGRRREKDIEMYISSSEDNECVSSVASSTSTDTEVKSIRSFSRRRRNVVRRNDRIRKSLRPRSHRTRVSRVRSFSHRKHSVRRKDVGEHVRVTRTSTFARKTSIRR